MQNWLSTGLSMTECCIDKSKESINMFECVGNAQYV